MDMFQSGSIPKIVSLIQKSYLIVQQQSNWESTQNQEAYVNMVDLDKSVKAKGKNIRK
ncbi:unnamed protein product [Paramecium octaurelia]|uniref:Uncharacterized protein n=1 Tax=Paramecium octaurelia TaxID=43137 RepID=A0A8S1XQW1_PAROT|nr:unnamed protein product [Paramecium octaurelia]